MKLTLKAILQITGCIFLFSLSFLFKNWFGVLLIMMAFVGFIYAGYKTREEGHGYWDDSDEVSNQRSDVQAFLAKRAEARRFRRGSIRSAARRTAASTRKSFRTERGSGTDALSVIGLEFAGLSQASLPEQERDCLDRRFQENGSTRRNSDLRGLEIPLPYPVEYRFKRSF